MRSEFHIAAVCVVLLAVVAIEHAFLAGRSVSIFLAIPVLFVGLGDQPWLTIVAAAVAILLELLSIFLVPKPPTYWPLGLVALIVVAGIATIGSWRRKQCALDNRRDRHDSAVQVAQDIRQPLTVIIGRCQLLLRREKPAPVADSLCAVVRAARRIDDIIQSVVLSDPAGP